MGSLFGVLLLWVATVFPPSWTRTWFNWWLATFFIRTLDYDTRQVIETWHLRIEILKILVHKLSFICLTVSRISEILIFMISSGGIENCSKFPSRIPSSPFSPRTLIGLKIWLKKFNKLTVALLHSLITDFQGWI